MQCFTKCTTVHGLLGKQTPKMNMYNGTIQSIPSRVRGCSFEHGQQKCITAYMTASHEVHPTKPNDFEMFICTRRYNTKWSPHSVTTAYYQKKKQVLTSTVTTAQYNFTNTQVNDRPQRQISAHTTHMHTQKVQADFTVLTLYRQGQTAVRRLSDYKPCRRKLPVHSVQKKNCSAPEDLLYTFAIKAA